MLNRHRNKIVMGVVAAVAVAGSAGAIAATGALSPQQECPAITGEGAARLGVTTGVLRAAFKSATTARVAAAFDAGRLTEAQATELKARIDSGDYPLFGLGPGGGRGHGPGFHHFADLDAAASYLGVTEAALRTELESGKTLAEVAEDKGKSVDGLVEAIVAAAKADLQDAVADGRLTDAQRDQIVATLEERITAKVNDELGLRGHGFGPGPGFGPAPDLDDEDDSSSSSTAAYVA